MPILIGADITHSGLGESTKASIAVLCVLENKLKAVGGGANLILSLSSYPIYKPIVTLHLVQIFLIDKKDADRTGNCLLRTLVWDL
ncbi:2573_t:CDS:2 [Entrophospora sp. SA101]|nr:2573_t:CDS:2 [Entrophospora sp. SA101]